mgnify:CR=1 FL=1
MHGIKTSRRLRQSYHSEHLDASVFVDEYYGFIDGKDDKYVRTVKAIEEELMHEGLLYRYKNADDFGLPSSSFTVCTFWFINSLYRIGLRRKSQRSCLTNCYRIAIIWGCLVRI